MRVLIVRDRRAVKISKRAYGAHQRREVVAQHKAKAQFIRAIAADWERTLQDDDELTLEEREQLQSQIERAQFDAIAVENCKCMDGQHS